MSVMLDMMRKCNGALHFCRGRTICSLVLPVILYLRMVIERTKKQHLHMVVLHCRQGGLTPAEGIKKVERSGIGKKRMRKKMKFETNKNGLLCQRQQ